uniref:Uncharacterized protein LOC100373321 n=1 Tax=Saccoglossus kowalevskii TaxID=10224 RepID=A0ABM0MBJ7_SACKO|nr:PREDICTED: uncharacterized protein LOC100373321 [Saccoglossus kowalevskii]
MANEFHFGDKVCKVSNSTAVELYIEYHHLNTTVDTFCTNITMCKVVHYSEYCEWLYTGTGLQYQLLAGPLFQVLFSVMGIPVSLIMEKFPINRKLVIASLRGFGLGLFHWGVYVAFSMAFVMDVVVDHLGWRWAYWITAVPGIVVTVLNGSDGERTTKRVAMGIFGSLLGGMLADKAAYYRGYAGRLYVFNMCIFVSIPLSIGVLYLSPPWCFILLIPNYAAIEMWGGGGAGVRGRRGGGGRRSRRGEEDGEVEGGEQIEKEEKDVLESEKDTD